MLEILAVPSKAAQQKMIVEALKSKTRASEKLFLLLIIIIGIGNHITQNGDGRQRRAITEKFIKMIEHALDGKVQN